MSAVLAATQPVFTPGVRYDMPEAEYHALPALGSGDVSRLHRSAAHYRAKADADDESTDAQVIGTAIHLAVLEPARFAAEVVVSPAFNRRTNAGKADAEAWALVHAGRVVLEQDDYDIAQRCGDAVRAHPAARALLAEGAPEVTLQWIDEATGTPCKARLDWLRPDMGVVDLKSTRDAAPAGFARSIATFGYARQAAHYSRGVRAVLGVDMPFWTFIAVEKEPPFAVGVYVLDDESMAAAGAQVEAAYARHAECRASGRWPAYSDLIQTISLPRWAL